MGSVHSLFIHFTTFGILNIQIVYAYIKGKLTSKSPTTVFLETGGIGYFISITLNTFSRIEKLDEVQLYTYLHVKEDDLSLYGFFSLEEKNLFVMLLSVSGIGPNTARIVLSSMTPLEVRTAIVTENDEAFKKVKGVGPKTAKRLILDLKDKVAKGSELIGAHIQPISNTRDEAMQALLGLGFHKHRIQTALNKIPISVDQPVEALIKYALRILS